MKAFLPCFTPALVLVWGTVAIAQTQSPISRDGSDWVQTSTGNVPICPACRLRVASEGNLVIRGRSGIDTVQYTLKKRVRRRIS